MNIKLIVLLTGLTSFGFLSLIFYYLPEVKDYAIKSQMILSEKSAIYKKWSNLETPRSLKIYFFSVKNARSAIRGEQIRVQEMGPYVFKKIKKKINITFSEDERLLRYYERTTYFFDAEASNGTLRDIITIINLPIITLSKLLDEATDKMRENPFAKPLVGLTLNSLLDFYNQNLFITKSINELTFKGYRVNLLDMLNLISLPLQFIGMKIPKSSLVNNTFGIFYGRNNTVEGPFEVFTGKDTDMSNFAQLKTWKGQSKLTYYTEPKCNVLNGSAEGLFKPHIKKYDDLYLFSQEICRSLKLSYMREEYINDEITAYRYVSPIKSGINRDNCLCGDKKYCDGLIDVSKCWKGAPILISNPHFLFSTVNPNVTGLSPDKEKHISYIDIEPTTGIVMRGAKRLSVNARVKPFKLIRSLESIKDGVVPFAWIEEIADVNEDIVTQLKYKIFIPLNYANASLLFLLGFSLLTILISSVLMFKSNTPKKITDNEFK